MVSRWIFAAVGATFLSLPHAESASHPRDDSLEVDLGYAKYRGVANELSGLNVWQGIRYAAAPTGDLRWQAPQLPATDQTVMDATTPGPQCPQSYPGQSVLGFDEGDEDCLFLNVFSPNDAPSEGLPVLIWIHGGGYGFGNGNQDMTEILNANDNNFVAVSIQYRLGAFGYLSSQEVMDKGVVNAGLLDQAFAMQWVQDFIGKFHGDPNRVTISGESSGGGSVMLHSTASDASLGTKYFKNAIAASPYLPSQWRYDDAEPTKRYDQFVDAVGCAEAKDTFECLVATDSMTLQMASNNISVDMTAYGEWAFLPVTDGKYITDLPTVYLEKKKVNGENMLVGNNANEGPLFAHNPASPLVTEDQVRAWLPEHFANLDQDEINKILSLYPAGPTELQVGQETDGTSAPFATNVSQDAVGQQQRANNIYAEGVFVCPSYWLASAFSGSGKSSYHYQYSVPFAEHQADIPGYFGPASENQSPDFVLAFRKLWGNFITKGNPSITNREANGVSADVTTPNAASDYPVWDDSNPRSINLNETGGEPYIAKTTWMTDVTQYKGPGLRNSISDFDANAWEAGRGARCAYWKSIASKIQK
ncbi:inactive carboxylesterase 4 [Xylariomycetidae sp. FL0641]|nr:inactive carboxylesterase 4 [Xylariomycetidae sp. FL0641]